MITRTHPAIERMPDVVVSRLIRSDYLHREFPVLVARVKQAKMQRERWGGGRG